MSAQPPAPDPDETCGSDGGISAPGNHRCECVMVRDHEEEWHGCRCGALWSDCPWCPAKCPQCVGDRQCECYTHQDEPAPAPPPAPDPDETVALDETAEQYLARTASTPDPDETCGRCGQVARGLATIDGKRYCHDGPDPTCYMRQCWDDSGATGHAPAPVPPATERWYPSHKAGDRA